MYPLLVLSDTSLLRSRSLRVPLPQRLGNICQDTFPLKILNCKLQRLSAEMHNGRGFFVLRGSPVNDFDRHDCVVA